jgi:progressive ankylosis protein
MSARTPASAGPTPLGILLFWAPLAAQWLMMAGEGPFLAAIIARMGDPAFNLAAYGVAFAFAILVESPVIMLMSASTALVEDAASYRRLRNFTNALNAGCTALLLLVLVPPVFDFVMRVLLGLPDEVTWRVYGALWLLLPWPAAIGYRRFLHGVLIRSGHTRLVAYGALLRLGGMAGMATYLYLRTELPGAWVGAAALTAGVCTEALATRIMAQRTVRRLLDPRAGVSAAARAAEASVGPAVAAAESATETAAETVATESAAAESAAAGAAAGPASSPADMSYGEIARFYYPLALTSFIALTVQPILTFFMGRSASPVVSLAVFPVVHALTFLFRSFGFAYQETVIALAGRRFEHIGVLARVGLVLGLVASGALALVAFTPLADIWFARVSALPPELANLATLAARIAVPMPALAVLLAFQQATLVKGRTTRPITVASASEVVVIAALFALVGWGLGMTDVLAAMIALLAGRLAGTTLLVAPVRRVLAGPGVLPPPPAVGSPDQPA